MYLPICLGVFFYNLVMFSVEGGFSLSIASRLIWLLFSSIGILTQCGLIGFRNIAQRFFLVENEIADINPHNHRRLPRKIRENEMTLSDNSFDSSLTY